MKIIWFTNMLLPHVADQIGAPSTANEGWLVGMAKALLVGKTSEIELVVCSPHTLNQKIYRGEVDGYRYIAYGASQNQNLYEPRLLEVFRKILKEEQPTVIHIMGSEKPRCYSIMQACTDLHMEINTVISIQGMVSIYEKHYCLGLPNSVIKGYKSFRDFLMRDSPEKGRQRYIDAGNYEVKALKMCKHVIGRTVWDKACTEQINLEAQYHFNNEVLRPSFYKGTWSIESCEQHSIFISQANYPVKGFHFALEALAIVATKYPDVKLYVAGSDALSDGKGKPAWRRTSYINFLFEKIEKYNLMDKIVFCGKLDEEDMKERFLGANVFVSASTIENSPNSVGEAMILGVPVVSSFVGGVSSILTHNEEGFLYPADEPYLLAHYICEVFENRKLACEISQNGRMRARKTHDREKNASELRMIYRQIAQNNK